MEIKTLHKTPYALILAFVVFISFFASPDISAIGDTPYTSGAHRGNSVLHIENTLDAIEVAVEDEQYQFIEIDLQYTKDGQIVVFHDLSLFRFQKQFFKVGDLTYDELVALSRYEVPKYKDVMDLIGDSKKINIEIKSQGNLEDDIKMVDFVREDIAKRGIAENCLFSSISVDVVKHIKSLGLDVGQIFLTTPASYFGADYFVEKFYDKVEETDADYLMMHGVNLRNFKQLVDHKPEGKTLVFWNFDDQMYVVHDDGQVRLW